MPILRQLAQLSASLVLISATAACVSEAEEGRPDEVQEGWRSGGKGDGETCDFASMSAATYYKQFAYETISSDSGDWFRVGLTWDVQAVLANGDRVDLDVYFLANDRVIVEYSEEHYENSGRSTVENQTVIVTRAQIDAATKTLTLVGVGSGTPLTVSNGRGGCVPSIDFTFSDDVRGAGLTGKRTAISAGLSTAYVIDPDHLDQVPNETARRWFQEDVASGKIKVIRK